MQGTSYNSTAGANPQLPNNLDEHILHHSTQTSFINTPAFIVLVLGITAVVGSLLGVLLAL